MNSTNTTTPSNRNVHESEVGAVSETGNELDHRVLVLALDASDAEQTEEVLRGDGLTATICPDVETLLREVAAGAGAIIATDDALTPAVKAALLDLLAKQPPWSDLPLIILTKPTADPASVHGDLLSAANVALLDRPVRVAALLTATRSALRGRERQYDLRERFQLQALLAAIVQGSEDAIVGKRLDGTILSWNDGAERLFGYTAAEAIGQPITLIIPHDRMDEERHIIERIRAGERVEHYETVRIRKGGAPVEVSLSISPVRDGANRIIGASKVARDIAQRRQIEAALREADRRKDEFLATLAHELRNPLAPIRNSLHILRVTAPPDPGVERVCGILERQVNHMVRLVDDLMEISRITLGKIELRKEQVEVAAVIGSAVEASKPAIDAAGQDLVVSISPEPLTLDADPVRLSQVLSNLLNNASKYSESRTTIWLTARRDGDDALISVRDSGIGIAPEMLPRVFDMFAQVERSLPRSQGGLGIGLTLVRSLVQMHGGQVDAKSAGIGRGSEFTVRLPLSTSERAGWTPRPAQHDVGLESLRILVVDDDRDAADSLGTMLSFLGAHVHVTYGGAAALDALEDFGPMVALLDIGMPGIDGFELGRRIRQQRRFQDIALIALSGWGTEEDKRRSLEAGFNFHLIKPPDVDALKALVASLGARPPRRGRAKAHK